MPRPVFKAAPSRISSTTLVAASGVADGPFRPVPKDKTRLFRKLTLVSAPVMMTFALLPAFWPIRFEVEFVALTVAPPETVRLVWP